MAYLALVRHGQSEWNALGLWTGLTDISLNDAGREEARHAAEAIKKVGSFDLVLAGRQASDTDGGQVHLGVAQHLGVPAVSPVQKIEEAAADSLTVQRIVEDGQAGSPGRQPKVH